MEQTTTALLPSVVFDIDYVSALGAHGCRVIPPGMGLILIEAALIIVQLALQVSRSPQACQVLVAATCRG
jgi:hypothetical protein